MINLLIRIEYGIAFLLILYFYGLLDFSLWTFFIFLLVPDITMIGYLFDKTIGATIYNFGHSLIIPLFLLVLSIALSMNWLLITSLIWLAHIFMDRCLGFGLKYKDSFQETHIQKV